MKAFNKKRKPNSVTIIMDNVNLICGYKKFKYKTQIIIKNNVNINGCELRNMVQNKTMFEINGSNNSIKNLRIITKNGMCIKNRKTFK